MLSFGTALLLFCNVPGVKLSSAPFYKVKIRLARAVSGDVSGAVDCVSYSRSLARFGNCIEHRAIPFVPVEDEPIGDPSRPGGRQTGLSLILLASRGETRREREMGALRARARAGQQAREEGGEGVAGRRSTSKACEGQGASKAAARQGVGGATYRSRSAF
jgi:hypothetical protein